jgi:lantibiotic modifying enzyme
VAGEGDFTFMSSNHQQYLATANQIGARLCRDAVWWESRCNWLGAAMEAVNGAWTVVERALGPDLYGGTSGIALFLARLCGITGEKPYRTTAIGALNQAWSKLNDIAPVGRAGFYSGWLGAAYTRLAVAEIPGLQAAGEPELKLIESLAGSDLNQVGLDVISGSAGAIPVLLELHRRFSKDWLLDFALRHGEHLLSTGRKRDEGRSWKTLDISTRDDLTGFSHGASGIAWALLELFRATGDQRWRDPAEEGFRYERRWFDSREGNWADLRNFNESPPSSNAPPACSMAWCHGAPGIALSRLRAWEILRDETYRREAEAALATTTKSLDAQSPSAPGNFSLCHGHAGNAESLLRASQVLDPGYARTVESAADRGIQLYESSHAPWPCGVNGGGETPNLMLGLAGIGHFYLRLSRLDAIPSVLMVHPPSGPTRATDSNTPRSEPTYPGRPDLAARS